jgi:drug/metabolite transporter (DMT)-like permease
MQYVEIVYAEIWGMLIFGEEPPWQSVLGACLVMACAIFTLLKKKDTAAPPPSSSSSQTAPRKG